MQPGKPVDRAVDRGRSRAGIAGHLSLNSTTRGLSGSVSLALDP